MLNNLQIEGLQTPVYDDSELTDDIHPSATIVRFEARKVDLPGESEKQGKDVSETRVFIVYEMHLGNMVAPRQIKDKVRLNPETGKWEVLALAKGMDVNQPRSHIKRHTAEWNAFARNVSADPSGTPLAVLFRSDPARADHYKRHNIETVETLIANESNVELLGMGALNDIGRAKLYLKKIKEQAPAIALNAAIEEKDRQLAKLSDQVSDLTAKLMELLNRDEPANEDKPVKRKRPSRAKAKTETQVEA